MLRIVEIDPPPVCYKHVTWLNDLQQHCGAKATRFQPLWMKCRILDILHTMCYSGTVSYRTIEIAWMPRSQVQWRTFTEVRQEAARLWGDLVERHHRLRCANHKWPTKERWQKWAKRKYPGLHSQSVQQIIGEFCEAVLAISQLRKQGRDEMRYPWRKPKYRDVIYTNQAALLRDGVLTLPNGFSGKLRIRIPVELPGRLMEVRLCLGRVLLTSEIPDEVKSVESTIGVDLGVNTLIAATDRERVVLVSGRAAKSVVRLRNKHLGSISAKQSHMVKGSQRWKHLQRRKAKTLAKTRRRLNDIMHKATRQIANAFPNAKCYVGKPFNDAAKYLRRQQAQQVSQACNAKMIRLLDYKTCGAIEVEEPYSSQTCPVCGRRSKQRRIYRCPCGVVLPRDAVGSVNIRQLGLHGHLLPVDHLPSFITYLRPWRSSPADTRHVARPSREAARL